MKTFFPFLLLLSSAFAGAAEPWEAGRIDYNDGTAEIAAFVNTPQKIQLQIVLCAKNEPINYRFSLIFPESLESSAFFKVKISSAGDTTQAFAELDGNTLDFQLDPSVFVNLPDAPDLSVEFEKDDADFLGVPQVLQIPMYGADITIKQIAAECGYLCINDDFKCQSPLIAAILWPRSGFIDDSVSELDELCTRGSEKAYSFNLSDKCKQALDLRFAAVGFEPLSFLDKLFHGKDANYVKYRRHWNEALSTRKTMKDPHNPDVEAEIAAEVDDYDWYLALYSIFGSRKLSDYPASYFAVLDLEEDPTTLLYNIDSRYDVETLKYVSVLLRDSDDNVDALIEKAISEWRLFYRDLSVSLPLIKEAQALRPLLYRSMLLRLWILAGKPQPIELSQKQMFVQGTDNKYTTDDVLEKKCAYFDGIRGDEFFYSSSSCTNAIRQALKKSDLINAEYKTLKAKWDDFADSWKKSVFYTDDAAGEDDGTLVTGLSLPLLSVYKIYGFGDYFLLRDCISSRDQDICSFEARNLYNTYKLELNNRLAAIDAVSKDDAAALKELSDKWQVYYDELNTYLKILVDSHKIPAWRACMVKGVAAVTQTNTILNAPYYKEELPDISLDSFDGDVQEE